MHPADLYSSRDGWTRTRIDAVAPPIRDMIDPAGFEDQEVFHISIPALDELGDGRLESSSSIGSQKLRLRGGEVLISKLNPRKSRVLLVSAQAAPILASGEFVALEPGPNCDSRFLAWLLRSSLFRQWLDSHVRSVTRSHQRVDPQFITQAQMWVPGIDQQRCIADYLDQATNRLNLIQDSRKRVARLARKRIDAVILSRVIPASADWPGDHPLDDLPLTTSIEGWSHMRLKDVIQGAHNGVWGDEPGGGPDDSFCVRVADFDYPHGRVASVPTRRAVPEGMRTKRALRVGDLLLEKSGGGEKQPVGRVVLWDRELSDPVVCSNFIARMRPQPGFDSSYLQLVHRALYACGVTMLSIKQTTGIQNLDAEHYLDRTISVPKLKEQIRIRTELEALVGCERRIADQSEQQVQLLDEHRDALITAAVTGELDPSSYRASAVAA